jgi:hypothetical protein
MERGLLVPEVGFRGQDARENPDLRLHELDLLLLGRDRLLQVRL